MLKQGKQAVLRSLKRSGVFTIVDRSKWRRQRLLILGYHGIAISDEHVWDDGHFIAQDVFRQRLQLLKTSGCAVLPLDEAIQRLYANDLPPRAVALTFDDGTTDFYHRAFPVLNEFGFPVTLYLTTFYSDYQKPIFDLMISYLLWKGREQVLDLSGITGIRSESTLSDKPARDEVTGEIRAFARSKGLSADEKDSLARSIAEQFKIDYDALLGQRKLHILSPDEVSELSGQGVDVQLHTHRHRTPRNRELFLREIEDNRKRLHQLTGKTAEHFCYPSGDYDPVFLPWLKEAGIVSATTCETGLASRDSHPLLLPRLLDVSRLSPVEFEGWLTGISSALPTRGGL
ncbi:MAG TPA: polysaccharide deacetylase family protein [Pyrinomonadaceae bacterium]|nr:polysaccharide deacetylase family protein [Pyrinomonadaceae bacterium]